VIILLLQDNIAFVL